MPTRMSIDGVAYQLQRVPVQRTQYREPPARIPEPQRHHAPKFRQLLRPERRIAATLHLVSVRRLFRKLPSWAWLSITLLLITGLFALIQAAIVHANSAGPNYANTAANDSTTTSCTTSPAWSIPANAQGPSDSAYASVTITSSTSGGVTSNCLKVTNFGFSIPTGSTINGIQVQVYKYATTATKYHIADNVVQLLKAGTAGGTNQATTSTWPSGPPATAVTYGSSSNTWGFSPSLTYSDINNSGFGVTIGPKNVKGTGSGSLTAYIDAVNITVTYTPPVTAYNQASYRLYGNAYSSSPATFAKAWGQSNLDVADAIIQTSDGGYAETGYTTGSNQDVFIAKYDGAGNLVWNTEWGGSGADVGYAIVQNTDGSFVVAGQYNGSVAFLTKFTSSGAASICVLWAGSPQASVATGLAMTSDGGYAMTGYTTGFNVGVQDVFLVKTDSSFNYTGCSVTCFQEVWYGGSTDQGSSVIQTSDGGYAITGYTNSSSLGYNDVLFLKVDPNGKLSGGSCGVIESEVFCSLRAAC